MNTVLLVGAAALAVYFLTRPKTTVNPYGTAALPPAYNPYAYNPYATQAPNPTSSIISASGQAAGAIINAIANL